MQQGWAAQAVTLFFTPGQRGWLYQGNNRDENTETEAWLTKGNVHLTHHVN